MKVPGLAWRVAGTGLRRSIRWLSCVMRCAGSTGWSLGVSSSPGILKGSPYTSSATDACRSSLNDVRMPRRTKGSASVQCWSWHMARRSVESFYVSVGGRVISGRAGKLHTT
jgi:hypothetical protein